jgi:signal transduction histidine kinase
MAHEFMRLGAAPPPELTAADLAWYSNRGRLLPDPPAIPQRSTQGERGDHENDRERPTDDIAAEEAFDGELAAIFVLSLDAQGRTIATPDSPDPPLLPDRQAVAAAGARGSDMRIGYMRDGSRARLLTYRVQGDDGTAFVQAGRTLTDQDRVLKQLLVGLIGLGGASVVLLSASSWWLAGRSLRPAQLSWERQQTFVANASHELRTPLTLLRASAEVALRGLPTQDADRRELLGDVLNETDHMSRLVDELLLLSRLDAGQLKIDRQPIDLPELLADVRRQIGRVADERGVYLDAGPASGMALGDAMRLRQVLLILLDNALRHTPAGGKICVEALSHGRHVDIMIADTGVGIAPEHLPHVFERFYRADSARGSSGSGLGLSIARGLIEAQRGQIAIASQPGQGTRVTVSLPRVEAPPAQP